LREVFRAHRGGVGSARTPQSYRIGHAPGCAEQARRAPVPGGFDYSQMRAAPAGV